MNTVVPWYGTHPLHDKLTGCHYLYFCTVCNNGWKLSFKTRESLKSGLKWILDWVKMWEHNRQEIH